jgi:hypothetical protein
MATFHLSVDLTGISGEAVAIALRAQADYIAQRYSLGAIHHSALTHDIRDDAGAVIGTWQVVDDVIASGPLVSCFHCGGSGKVPTAGKPIPCC